MRRTASGHEEDHDRSGRGTWGRGWSDHEKNNQNKASRRLVEPELGISVTRIRGLEYQKVIT